VRAGMSEIKLTYLIGELHRQLGDYNQALRYFSRVVEHPMKASEPQMVRTARDQWQMMREEMKRQREAAEQEAQ
jgi:uncharacterized protein (DUF2225 family)